ncbi:hypothetical protein BBJ28_00002362 [Nothophytophthora sp. Chile5]|nr:hypothetical protein BBJ28_00002362 [Nothophytophthora sp. Chile5]
MTDDTNQIGIQQDLARWDLYDSQGEVNPESAAAMRYLFRRFRASRGEPVEGATYKSLRLSWNAFIKRWNLEPNFAAVLRDREASRRRYRFGSLREELHAMCWDEDRYCYVNVVEPCPHCSSNLERPSHRISMGAYQARSAATEQEPPTTPPRAQIAAPAAPVSSNVSQMALMRHASDEATNRSLDAEETSDRLRDELFRLTGELARMTQRTDAFTAQFREMREFVGYKPTQPPSKKRKTSRYAPVETAQP